MPSLTLTEDDGQKFVDFAHIAHKAGLTAAGLTGNVSKLEASLAQW